MHPVVRDDVTFCDAKLKLHLLNQLDCYKTLALMSLWCTPKDSDWLQCVCVGLRRIVTWLQAHILSMRFSSSVKSISKPFSYVQHLRVVCVRAVDLIFVCVVKLKPSTSAWVWVVAEEDRNGKKAHMELIISCHISPWPEAICFNCILRSNMAPKFLS